MYGSKKSKGSLRFWHNGLPYLWAWTEQKASTSAKYMTLLLWELPVLGLLISKAFMFDMRDRYRYVLTKFLRSLHITSKAAADVNWIMDGSAPWTEF